MASGKNQSLWDYLTKENPEITINNCAHGLNTTTKRGTWIEPRQIEPWQDFELYSLQSIYDGSLRRILQREFNLERFDSIPPLPFREIHDENSLECLLVKWNHSVVSHALQTAQENLRYQWNSENIFMVRGGQARIPTDFGGILKPDWGAIQRAAEDVGTLKVQKSHNILPGETKLSKKWHSSGIRRGVVRSQDRKAQWFLPLCQLFTYCVRCNSRYGYLITDQELVAVRVKPHSTEDAQTDSQGASVRGGESQESYKPPLETPSRQTEKSGILEYKAIPWTHKDNESNQERGLTVNLALWWLHMMAAMDNSIALEYEPMSSEKLGPAASELNSSFAISEVRHELEDSSLGEKYGGSFESHLPKQPNEQKKKRPKNFAEGRDIRQKKKYKASQ